MQDTKTNEEQAGGQVSRGGSDRSGNKVKRGSLARQQGGGRGASPARHPPHHSHCTRGRAEAPPPHRARTHAHTQLEVGREPGPKRKSGGQAGVVPCMRIPQRLYKRKTTLGFSRILRVSLGPAGREAENPAAAAAAPTAAASSFASSSSSSSSLRARSPPSRSRRRRRLRRRSVSLSLSSGVKRRTRVARVCNGGERLLAPPPLPN